MSGNLILPAFAGVTFRRLAQLGQRLGARYPPRVTTQADDAGKNEQILDLRLRKCRDGSALSPHDSSTLGIAAGTPEEQPDAA